MLVEYLDDASKEIGEIKQKAHKIKRQYNESMDKDLMLELANLNKKIKVKKQNIWETIYENLEEFRFMKKYFPQLLQVYLEDESIGRIIRTKMWLADYEEMRRELAAHQLRNLKKDILLLKQLKITAKDIPEPYTKEKLGNSWELLEGKINNRTDDYELSQLVDEEIVARRRMGWSILLNEPYVMKYANRFLEKLKNAVKGEVQAKIKLEQSNGQGTYWEYKAKQEMNAAIKERKSAERYCRHLFMANPKFHAKFKKQNMVWRDKDVAIFMSKFLSEISTPHIDEKEWVREMKKKIEN